MRSGLGDQKVDQILLKVFQRKQCSGHKATHRMTNYCHTCGSEFLTLFEKKGKEGRKEKNHHDRILSIIGKLFGTSACI